MEQEIELIENYLAGTLSESERKETEQRLQNDPKFAERVTLIQDMRQAVNSPVEDFRNDLREEFDAYQSRHQTERTPSPFFERPYLIAASVLLLVGLFAIYMVFLKSPSPQQLYASNFSPPPENITIRNDDVADTELQLALKAYNDQQYTVALNHFDKTSRTIPENEAVLFYSGICHLALEESEAAGERFQQILQSSNYGTAAQWYLGLSYLQIGKSDKAKTVFEALAKASQSNYAKKAEYILQNLP